MSDGDLFMHSQYMHIDLLCRENTKVLSLKRLRAAGFRVNELSGDKPTPTLR